MDFLATGKIFATACFYIKLTVLLVLHLTPMTINLRSDDRADTNELRKPDIYHVIDENHGTVTLVHSSQSISCIIIVHKPFYITNDI